MGTGQLDRLLPRHPLDIGVAIDWNVREERHGFLRREATSDPGRIADLSLEGALIDVPSGPVCAVGDVIVVRIDGVEGRVQVRHREDADETGGVRYGVRFLDDHELSELVGQMVGLLRDHEGRIAAAWKHAR
jgi:hypothetical protein